MVAARMDSTPRRLVLESNRDAARQIVRRLDDPSWRTAKREGELVVAFSDAVSPGTRAYRTRSVHDATPETLAEWLGDGLFDAMGCMNPHYAGGAVLSETPLIVRTDFALPFPLAARSFFHGLTRTRWDDTTWVVAYSPVDPTGMPTMGRRCPIHWSGQRIRLREDGRTEVEHMMSYRLGGRIPVWTQTYLMHVAHAEAYLDEWGRLAHMTRLFHTEPQRDHAQAS